MSLPDVKKALNEALMKVSNGFVKVLAVNITGSHTEPGYNGVEYYVAEYTGKAALTRKAAISTANSTHLETNTDLTKFIEVPTPESLSGKIEKSAVFQIWMPETEFAFSGKAWFFKGSEGWEVAHNYSGPAMSTVVVAGAKPSGYLIFKLTDGNLTSIQASKPYIDINPPTASLAQDFLRKHVDWLSGCSYEYSDCQNPCIRIVRMQAFVSIESMHSHWLNPIITSSYPAISAIIFGTDTSQNEYKEMKKVYES